MSIETIKIQVLQSCKNLIVDETIVNQSCLDRAAALQVAAKRLSELGILAKVREVFFTLRNDKKEMLVRTELDNLNSEDGSWVRAVEKGERNDH